MAKDFMLDDKGDWVIDPSTHDFVFISGLDEVAQRIKTTLLINFGEMQELDPNMGMDYSNFLGKHFNKAAATADITACITDNVEEVQSVDSIKFTKEPNRHLRVDFTCTATADGQTGTVEGGYDIGS